MTAPKLCCPHCQQFESHVLDTRANRNMTHIWRRRECAHCREKFTTYERVVGNYRGKSVNGYATTTSSSAPSTSTRNL